MGMGLFKKKTDPIADRSRALSAEIAALEAQIQKLNTTASEPAPRPKVRSTAMPPAMASAPAQPSSAPTAEAASDPVFERVDRHRIEAPMDTASTPEHYNDLGVRKYDMVALIRRVKHHFQGPSNNNPQLINYLAAGSIQGLRPLRYEKRVARNRVIALALFLLLVLFGIFSFLFRNR